MPPPGGEGGWKRRQPKTRKAFLVDQKLIAYAWGKKQAQQTTEEGAGKGGNCRISNERGGGKLRGGFARMGEGPEQALHSIAKGE